MTVEKILACKKETYVYTIRPDARISEAAKLMNEKHIGALMVVTEHQHIHGIISERDIVRICAAAEGFCDVQVQDVMTPKARLIVSNIENDLRYVMSIMAENNIRHIPIVNGEQLISVLSMRDVAKALLTEYEKQLLTVDEPD